MRCPLNRPSTNLNVSPQILLPIPWIPTPTPCTSTTPMPTTLPPGLIKSLPRTTTTLPATQVTPPRFNNSRIIPRATTWNSCRMIFLRIFFWLCLIPLSRLTRAYKIKSTNKMCSRLTTSFFSLCLNPCSKISTTLLFLVKLCFNFTTIWYRQLADSSKIILTVGSLT